MMNDDDQILLNWEEQRALAGIERVLAAGEPVLAATLRHGVAPPAAPRRQTVAVALLTSCLLIGVSTFAGGEPAGLVVAAGLGALCAVAATALSIRSARRRRAGPFTGAGNPGRRARGSG